MTASLNGLARLGSLVLVALSTGSLCACGGAPEQSLETKLETRLEVELTAASDAIAGPGGQSMPVSVRLFELSEVGRFDRGDFFGLYDQPERLLEGDLLKREQFTLAPGEERRIARTAAPGIRHLSVVVGYRDIDSTRWRASVPIRANQVNFIAWDIRSDGVSTKTQLGRRPGE